MHEKRREFFNSLIENQKGLGIEIGPLDNPIVVRDDLSEGCEILYADHLTTEELKEKYRKDASIDLTRLVEVDLINALGDYSSELDGRLVDYVVASHVVEHVPNPILWLQMLFKVIRPGGFVFLVVPDKRFTFDFQRPTTTLGEMLESFLSEKKRPSVRDVFDHHSAAVMIDGSRVWNGILRKEELIPLASTEDALKYAQEVHSNGVYRDVHVSIFTPLSFFAIIEGLIKTQLLMLEVTEFNDTSANDIEFFVCLKKPEDSRKYTREICLESLPSLSLHSLTSPYMPQVESLSESLRAITNTHTEFQNSFVRLEAEKELLKEQMEVIKEQLRLLQKVLDRKSVRVVMALIHIVFNAASVFRRNRH
jgi:hypothetical protein